MDNFKKFYTEGLSSILFHLTDLPSSISILKNNKFRMTTAFDSTPDLKLQGGKNLYFLSTTRSPMGEYNGGNVRLVLDGKKLSNNFKGKPVDFFGGHKWAKDEMEDRLITDKPFIPNASKYIKEIHIHLNMKYYITDMRWQSWVNNLNKLADKQSIPLFIYDNVKDWKFGRKARAIDLDTHDIEEKPFMKMSNTYDNKKLNAFMELYTKSEFNELSDESQKVLATIKTDVSEATRDLRGFISNNRTSGILGDLIKIMQKKKYSTADEFMDAMKKKWIVVDPTKEIESLNLKKLKQKERILNRMERVVDKLENYLAAEKYDDVLALYKKFLGYYPVDKYPNTPVDKLRKTMTKEIDNLMDIGNEVEATEKWDIFKKSFGDESLPYFD